MPAPKTSTLLVVGAVLVLAGGLFFRPVTKLKPVLTSTGEVVLHPDGRPRYREDKMATFLANWDAHLIVACGVLCLVWVGGRGIAALYVRLGYRHESP